MISMPSTKGDGRPAAEQLTLTAPAFDRYGLHAIECECQRCEIGNRPTLEMREAARRAWERLEARRKRDAERAAGGTVKERKRSARAEAFREEEKYTDQLIRKLSAPVERPATPEELAELKAAYPNLAKKGRP
jgi:hypothetical protein